jgi:hypothetical protein
MACLERDPRAIGQTGIPLVSVGRGPAHGVCGLSAAQRAHLRLGTGRSVCGDVSIGIGPSTVVPAAQLSQETVPLSLCCSGMCFAGSDIQV